MNRYDTEETEEETEQREKKYLAFMQADEDAKNGARALHEEQPPEAHKPPSRPARPVRAKAPPRAKETFDDPTSGAGKALTFDRKDADALEGALEALGINVRYNLRAMQPEVSTGGGPWAKTTDRSRADLRRLIAGKFSYRLAGKRETAPLRYGRDSWDEHFNALLHHREIDPFKAWLESLPEWDGKGRLAKLLPDCLGADDGPLTRWAGAYLTVGGVQRTYDPGCQLRQIPILIGAQGIGKSRLLRSLLPEDQPDWFSDSLCVSDPSKTRLEAILKRVIVELSELTGFRRAELESLKAFISRTDDGATRLAYRRDPETALRRCILVGSTNDTECLPNDPSGNTRFVPIQCGAGSHVEPVPRRAPGPAMGRGAGALPQGRAGESPARPHGPASQAWRETPAQGCDYRRCCGGDHRGRAVYDQRDLQ